MQISRTDRSVFGHWWWTIDRGVLGALMLLVLIGVLLVSSASPAVAERINLPAFHFLTRHIIFLIPTLAAMIGLSFMGPKGIRRSAILAYAGSMTLVFATLFLGEEIKGATRWLHVFGFSLQPSEFLKPSFAVLSAWLIARQRDDRNFPGLTASFVILFMTLLFLMAQPDFGMSFVIAFIWGVQIFLSGLPFALFAVLGLAGFCAIIAAYFSFPHVASRIDRFLNPASGDNYQVEKSLDSFANGGMFGTGPAQGQIKLSLPDSHADFIFAVAGEEFGLIFTVLIVCVYAFIIIRSMKRTMPTGDLFILLSVGGLIAQFALQALIHMGSSIQLLPAKGMTLPFISYGGSSLLALGMAMGFLLALTKKRPEAIRKRNVSARYTYGQGRKDDYDR